MNIENKNKKVSNWKWPPSTLGVLSVSPAALFPLLYLHSLVSLLPRVKPSYFQFPLLAPSSMPSSIHHVSAPLGSLFWRVLPSLVIFKSKPLPKERCKKKEEKGNMLHFQTDPRALSKYIRGVHTPIHFPGLRMKFLRRMWFWHLAGCWITYVVRMKTHLGIYCHILFDYSFTDTMVTDRLIFWAQIQKFESRNINVKESLDHFQNI